MRILIIGYGSVGRRHALNAQALGHEVLTRDVLQSAEDRAVADSVVVGAPDDFAFDAMVVAVPSSLHGCFLGRGWHDIPMLIEKPLALTVAEAEAGDEREAFTMVGYNWRWHPDIVGAMEAWPEPPDRIHLDCNTMIADWPGSDYADPLVECSHEMDLLRWMRGGDLTLVAAGPQDGYQGCWLEFERGDRIDLRWNAPPSRRLIAQWGGRYPEQAIWPSLGAALEQSYRKELAWFLALVKSGREAMWTVNVGRPRYATFADGLAVLKICEQAKALLVAAV